MADKSKNVDRFIWQPGQTKSKTELPKGADKTPAKT